MAKQDDYIRYTIRVPANIYQRVREAADEHERSINAEIISLIGSGLDELDQYKAMKEWHAEPIDPDWEDEITYSPTLDSLDNKINSLADILRNIQNTLNKSIAHNLKKATDK